MPKIRANNITLNYEQQGSGDPLILILSFAKTPSVGQVVDLSALIRRENPSSMITLLLL
jgi:hypothetical protein